jgi:hypothetical protein
MRKDYTSDEKRSKSSCAEKEELVMRKDTSDMKRF